MVLPRLGFRALTRTGGATVISCTIKFRPTPRQERQLNRWLWHLTAWTSARLAQAQRGHRRRLTARLLERTASQRKDRNHKLSRWLVSENRLIAWSKDSTRRHRPQVRQVCHLVRSLSASRNAALQMPFRRCAVHRSSVSEFHSALFGMFGPHGSDRFSRAEGKSLGL